MGKIKQKKISLSLSYIFPQQYRRKIHFSLYYSSLVWNYTVCPGLFVRKLRITMLSNKWLQQKNEPPHDKTNKMTVRPAKTRISLGIRPVWSTSSLCTQWAAKGRSFLQADSKDSDQTGWMPRLIWVFAGCTCHFAGFVMRRLKY